MSAPVTSSERGWESLFWMLFERSANAILLVNEQRQVIEANPPFLVLLGYTRGALIGRTLTDFIVSRERPESWDAWRDFLAKGEYSGTRVFVRSDNTETTIEFAARMADVGERRLAVYVADANGGPKRFSRPGRCDARALTDREREVVRLIALGRETNRIADALSVSPETVRTHVRNAMRKLGVHTRAQLVAVCLTLETDVAALLLE